MSNQDDFASVRYIVDDVEAAIDFYTRHLGFAVRSHPAPPFADVTREQLEAQGLYAVLRERGARPVVAHQAIGARTPSASERRHLQLKPSEPVLTMTRSAFDATGNAVEYGDHCYRAQDYSIEVMIDER